MIKHNKTISKSEQELFQRAKLMPLPRHIAVIMDGNGRWAKMRSLPRVEGHRAGISAVRTIVEGCAEIGVEYLTLYAFSTENWKRPRSEINTLMRLLKSYIDKELETLIVKNIKFSAIGRTYQLHTSVIKKLDNATAETAHCTGLHFIVALNYSGRAEIIDSVKRMTIDSVNGRIDINRLDEQRFSKYLYTDGIPDPDLLIRTSGEYRVSNFLLWQIAYSEIWITETFWPDFSKELLYTAILDFQKRERRYGGLGQ